MGAVAETDRERAPPPASAPAPVEARAPAERGAPLETWLWLGVARAALLLAVGYLAFGVFRPFFSAMVWAGVLVLGLYPGYTRLVAATRGRRTLSALIMSLLLTVGITVPLVYLVVEVGQQLVALSQLVVGPVGAATVLERLEKVPLFAAFLRELQAFGHATGTDFSSSLSDSLNQVGQATVRQVSFALRNLLVGVGELAIVLVGSFYLFRDGQDLLAWVSRVMPLPLRAQQRLVIRVREVVRGALFASSAVALGEGVLGGLALGLVGAPVPVLWGALITLASFLPLVGATVVWAPWAGWYFSQGEYGKALALLVVGVAIAAIDYFVRTLVVGRASRLHTLLTLFGVLGGISFFGIVGIVAGPLVVALGVALLEVYRPAPGERAG